MGESLRVVVLGQTFAVKAELKALGFRWDGETQRWWQEIEAEALDELELATAKLQGVSIDTETGEMCPGASLWSMSLPFDGWLDRPWPRRSCATQR